MGGGAARGATLLVVLAAAGCATRGDAGPRAESPALMGARDRARLEATALERANDPLEGYRIGPDDLLDIRIPDLVTAGPSAAPRTAGASLPAVAETPAAQQGFRVSAAGEVSVPLIGAVRADGKTAPALAAEIARRLVASGILRRPEVTVTVAEYRSHVVAVVGSVERPGVYPLTRPGARVADLVWAAGGPGKDAGRVVEFKPVGTQDVPIRIDLELLLHVSADGASTLNPRVRAGDVISVAPAGTIHVSGWVEKPGSYPVTRGLTLSGAVAAAGGHLFPADRRHATVKRVLAPGDERSFTVDLDAVATGASADVPLADGDVVRLPAHAGRLVPYGLWIAAKDLVHVGGSVPLF